MALASPKSPLAEPGVNVRSLQLARPRALSDRMDPSVDKKTLQIQKLEHILVDQIASI